MLSSTSIASDKTSYNSTKLTRKGSYRHYVMWAFIWWFMVSGGLDAGWPVGFSLWTQTPYVVSYALVFYITLFWVAPMLHRNKVQLIIRSFVVAVGYLLVYMGLNRIIPEWEDGSSVFYEYTVASEVEESVVMLIFIWLPVYGLYYNRISILRVKEVAEEEVKLAQNRLKLYKSEFNAHLTFNTLSLIYSRAVGDTTVAEPILLLSDILRYNTTIEADRVVPLSSEITHLQNFIRIHQIIYPDIFIEFSIQGEVDNLSVLPRVFVNFVENAVKHGIGNHRDFPIEVTLCTTERIDFSVRNKKRSTYPSEKSTRKGHYLTTQTLKAFYGDLFDLKIIESKEWYEAHLSITISENKLLSTNHSTSLL